MLLKLKANKIHLAIPNLCLKYILLKLNVKSTSKPLIVSYGHYGLSCVVNRKWMFFTKLADASFEPEYYGFSKRYQLGSSSL